MTRLKSVLLEYQSAVTRCIATSRAALWALLGVSFIAAPLAADVTVESKWDRLHSSYRFSTVESVSRHAPDEGTPLRAVYNAMSAIGQRDVEALVELFADEAHPSLRDFVRLWAPRLQDRTLELRHQGMRKDNGMAYIGIIGQLGGPNSSDRRSFAEVIFLKLVDGEWKLTDQVLDSAERARVIESLDMMRVRSPAEQSAARARVEERSERFRREAHERAYRIGMEMMGEDVDEDEMGRDYHRQRARDAYLEQRVKDGTYPTVFNEVVDLYEVELFDPPIGFDVTEEVRNPNFDSLSDAIRTTFYLSALKLSIGRNGERFAKTRLGWRYESIDEVEVPGGLPAFLPALFADHTTITLAGLGVVQIRAIVPVSYEGEEYRVVFFTMVESDSTSHLLLPIANPDETHVGAGFTYFKREGNRWVPSSDMGGYSGLGGIVHWKRVGGFYYRRHQVWAFRKEIAQEILENDEGWPDSMRKLYSAEETRDITAVQARSAGSVMSGRNEREGEREGARLQIQELNDVR